MNANRTTALAAIMLAIVLATPRARADAREHPDLALFFQAASPESAVAEAALDEIAVSWQDGYTPMIVDVARVLRPDQRRLIRFLEQQTGQRFGDDLDRWRRWMWALPYEPHPDYGPFKGRIYGTIDPRMRGFFPRDVQSLIRLDQVDWGGVSVNGIPPLDHPKRIAAGEAVFLKDKHVVFGLVVNGSARAYPKRIMAWHELARDNLGGVELAIVYCTLCGTVIPYESELGGTRYTFGTSGLLYRSNKLMFDEETQSLWSSVYGEPVVGSLTGRGIKLASRPVVTTTWGEWKAVHPETTVLSLETGFSRDYGEGVAYRDYFSTDELMFAVPHAGGGLKNKAEVLVLPYTTQATSRDDGRPVAVSADFLKKHTIYHLERAGKRLLILTSRQGANRVYVVGEGRFVRWLDGGRIEDEHDVAWRVTEEALVAEDDSERSWPRLPAHRAFWFGWYAQYPDTELIK